jgi:hypothetical protein
VFIPSPAPAIPLPRERRLPERREAPTVEIIHGEPMPAAYLPVDPLVFAIKQRLES